DVDLAVGDRAGVALEMSVEEAIDGLANVLAIGVPADADDGIDAVPRAIQAVEPLQPADDPFVGIHRKNAVLVAVDEEHGPWSDQAGNPRPGPLERVVEKHAVAVAVDHPVGHVRFEVRHAADWSRDLQALV